MHLLALFSIFFFFLNFIVSDALEAAEEQPGSEPGMPELFSAQGTRPGCEQQVCTGLKTCRSVGQVANTLIQLLLKAAIC